MAKSRDEQDEVARAVSRARKLHLVRVVLAFLGVALALAVPMRLGFAEVYASLKPALPVLPLCVLCELGRVVCEAFATRLALGRRVPWGVMTLAHLGAYAAITVFPAPRPAAEALKTTVLGEHVGIPESASAGATLQAATFFSVGSMCFLAAFFTWGTPLSWVLLGNTTLLYTLGTLLRVVMRSGRAAAWFKKKWPKRHNEIDRLHAVARTGHVLALGPSACLLASLFIKVLEQVFITKAMGGTPTLAGSVANEGVRLIGASIGVLVPGQMGVREAVFAFSAESLGTTAAHATAISLFTHAIELSLAFIGFAALLVFRIKPKVNGAPR